jgi:S1-C subfamily serine protease
MTPARSGVKATLQFSRYAALTPCAPDLGVRHDARDCRVNGAHPLTVKVDYPAPQEAHYRCEAAAAATRDPNLMRFMQPLAPGRSGFLLFALLCLTPQAQASRWVEVGTSGVTTDKVMVDADSIQKIEEFTVTSIMTLYAAPRTNSHNILMDRHVQKMAFNCADHTAVSIVTVGYLGDKKVGTGPETLDWRLKAKPLTPDPINSRVLTLVCGSQAAPAAAKPKGTSGSGIVVDDQGAILTNSHVVKGCKLIMVKAPDSRALEATLEGVDPKNDLAILRTLEKAPVGEPAHFRSPTLPAKLGESIGVVGYPLTGYLSSEPKATFGQISSVAGVNNDYTVLQISAPVQPGSSGGPVVDSGGLVIGVVVAQLTGSAGAIPQNVNFAIRGEVAQVFLEARGIALLTRPHHAALSTEAMAAAAQKSTVAVQCLFESPQ